MRGQPYVQAGLMPHRPQLPPQQQQQQQQQQQLAARGPPAAQGRGGAAAAAAAAQQQAAAQADARRLAGKKRKVAEKPAVVEKPLHLIPESPLFNSLMMQEHQVGELVKRKRLELQAAANPLECAVPKRLRVYIFNTHSHQPSPPAAPGSDPQQKQQKQQGDSSSSEPPQWTLVVWGRLENADPPAAPAAPSAAAAAAAAGGASSSGGAAAAAGGGDAAAATAAAAVPALNVHALPPQPAKEQQASQHKHPFTGFFKSIRIQLDPEQYPDNSTVTWDKLQHRGPHKDRIEVKRVGSQPVKVSITFDQDFAPPAYKVDPRLAEVIGMSFGQQQTLLTRLYSYIIAATQQADLSQLQLDDKLAAIFGAKQLAAAALPQELGKLLQPLEPVTVTHTIQTAGGSPSGVTCVDFDVLLPVRLQDKVSPVIDPLLDDKQFDAQEQKLVTSLTKLFECRRRRSMYLGFAEDPVSFLNTIIASQAREFRARENKVAIERRTDLFREKWVDEAALRYLGRKSKQDALFPPLNTQPPQQ